MPPGRVFGRIPPSLEGWIAFCRKKRVCYFSSPLGESHLTLAVVSWGALYWTLRQKKGVNSTLGSCRFPMGCMFGAWKVCLWGLSWRPINLCLLLQLLQKEKRPCGNQQEKGTLVCKLTENSALRTTAINLGPKTLQTYSLIHVQSEINDCLVYETNSHWV